MRGMCASGGFPVCFGIRFPECGVTAANAWRRRAQTYPLVDWGGVTPKLRGTLLHRLFFPP